MRSSPTYSALDAGEDVGGGVGRGTGAPRKDKATKMSVTSHTGKQPSDSSLLVPSDVGLRIEPGTAPTGMPRSSAAETVCIEPTAVPTLDDDHHVAEGGQEVIALGGSATSRCVSRPGTPKTPPLAWPPGPTAGRGGAGKDRPAHRPPPPPAAPPTRTPPRGPHRRSRAPVRSRRWPRPRPDQRRTGPPHRCRNGVGLRVPTRATVGCRSRVVGSPWQKSTGGASGSPASRSG
jgi:hypothetical protein